MPSTSARTYLVADLFCGAGGTSTGASRAIANMGGRIELVAVNHWQTAVETHSQNHPQARHLVADLSAADPATLVPEGRLDLLLASPECTYHSRARGGKPIRDQSRTNPWAVHHWMTELDINCVIVENVPEFVNWGPVGQNGKPDKSHRGQYFQAWFLAFAGLGYKAEWRMLTAADYGDATTRTRFFLVARRDGRPVVWPEPTHARIGAEPTDTMLAGRNPWRSAADIIDWSQDGCSILDAPKYRRTPLRPNTRRRIAYGLQQYGGPMAQQYTPLLDLPDDNRMATQIPQPVRQTRQCASRTAHGTRLRYSGAPDLPQPFIVQYNGTGTAHPVHRPLSTVTTIAKHGLTVPATVPLGSYLQSDPDAECRQAQESDAGDPRRLIVVDDVPHLLDIRYRMLSNAELARAMGFIDADHDYRFAGTTAEVTRQIGNAVPVNTAYALVAATLGQTGR